MQGLDTLITALVLATGQVDAHRIMAHADTVRNLSGVYFPNSVALALSWKESRSGRTGNKARGPGIWKSKTTGKSCRETEPCMPGDSVRKCIEIGRMQLSPCHDYTKLDQRCTFYNIRESYDTNVHCGLLWFIEKLKTCQGDLACGIERYNGNGCVKVQEQKFCSTDYRKEALSYIGNLCINKDRILVENICIGGNKKRKIGIY